MLYFFKFAASFLLPPGIFFVGLFVIAFHLYQCRKKTVSIILAGITFAFYLLSTSFVGDLLLGSLEQRYNVPAQVSGDVIVQLGGGATADTPDIDGKGNLSGNAANRILTAVRLHRLLGVPILSSGGQVFADTGREAVVSKRILLGLGVTEESIILDDSSLNTRQNAENVKKLLQERGFHHPILVTSAFHMERSVLNFAKYDIPVTPFPVDYMVNKQQAIYANRFAPSADGLRNSVMFLREWLGIWALKSGIGA